MNERYDHRSSDAFCDRNYNVSPKENQASTESEPTTFALPVRCSTNCATKPSKLGAGQFVGFTSAILAYERNDRRYSERNQKKCLICHV